MYKVRLVYKVAILCIKSILKKSSEYLTSFQNFNNMIVFYCSKIIFENDVLFFIVLNFRKNIRRIKMLNFLSGIGIIVLFSSISPILYLDGVEPVI